MSDFLTSDPLDATTQLKPGTSIYDASGYEYEFSRAISDTEWLCYPMVEVQGWGDSGPEMIAGGNLIIINPARLYQKPPVPVVHADIKRLRDELQALRDDIRITRSQKLDFERDEKARLARLARHAQLALVDDWVGDKITHLVRQTKTGAWSITSREDEVTTDGNSYTSKKKMRLLTLWGDRGGDLQWRLGQYSDHSGTQYEVVPCGSYDEALAVVRKMCDEAFAAWEADNSISAEIAYQTALEFKFPIPDSLVAAKKLLKIASAQHLVDQARENFAKAATKLDEARR